jgi:hypothetical protein
MYCIFVFIHKSGGFFPLKEVFQTGEMFLLSMIEDTESRVIGSKKEKSCILSILLIPAGDTSRMYKIPQ